MTAATILTTNDEGTHEVALVLFEGDRHPREGGFARHDERLVHLGVVEHAVAVLCQEVLLVWGREERYDQVGPQLFMPDKLCRMTHAADPAWSCDRCSIQTLSK